MSRHPEKAARGQYRSTGLILDNRNIKRAFPCKHTFYSALEEVLSVAADAVYSEEVCSDDAGGTPSTGDALIAGDISAEEPVSCSAREEDEALTGSMDSEEEEVSAPDKELVDATEEAGVDVEVLMKLSDDDDELSLTVLSCCTAL